MDNQLEGLLANLLAILQANHQVNLLGALLENRALIPLVNPLANLAGSQHHCRVTNLQVSLVDSPLANLVDNQLVNLQPGPRVNPVDNQLAIHLGILVGSLQRIQAGSLQENPMVNPQAIQVGNHQGGQVVSLLVNQVGNQLGYQVESPLLAQHFSLLVGPLHTQV